MDALRNGGDPQSFAEIVYLRAQLLYPMVLLLAFILSAGVHSIVTARSEEELIVPTVTGPGGKPLPVTKRKREQSGEIQVPAIADDRSFARRVFQYGTAALTLSFLANLAAIAVHTLQVHGPKHFQWWCGEERTVYVVGSTFLYVYVLITLFDWSRSPNVVHFIVWTLALIGETIILLSFALMINNDQYNLAGKKKDTGSTTGIDPWDLADLGIGAVRLTLVGLLVCLYATLTAKKYLKERRLLDEEANRSDVDETSPLLGSNDGISTNYRTQTNDRTANGRCRDGTDFDRSDSAATGDTDSGFQQKDEEAAFYRPQKLPHKTWFEYCRGYSVFFPYLWPSDSLRLKGVVLLCFILVVFQRVVNILVPEQVGNVTNILTDGAAGGSTPWIQMGLLVLYKLLQGPSGLLGSARALLWIPVSQHTYRALTTAAFEHVHSLSLDFHLGKRTGEVLSALNKGASINAFLEQMTFQVVPMLVDLLIAIVFLYIRLGPIYALFVSIITFYYLLLTIRMAATRADQRRDMVNADREEVAVKNDSIMSYETVKYFNAEQYEFKRYRDAIITFQNAEAKVTWGINYMNMCQSLVFMCGILVALMTCAFQVSQGTREVGDFTLLLTYLGQLQGPLNFFGTFYRTVQQAMISGERLLELFKIQPTVVDKPDAGTLRNCDGHIKWEGVGFSYDRRRPALRDLSFECTPGSTTAFVGESGGGKSTVFRLMFRYYNCHEGSIKIGGHDVKDMTIDSVRRFIGVVPQDTILFNETLMYNLKYANPNATDDEVFEACRAAAIHDRIMAFPDGYDTKVGERGLRLSGGEKQRVAIARTILKNPKIIMLDEATSALDGETEQKIQSKLISGKFGTGRTLLIIAHRLSTITHADQIIVLHQGKMVEKGTHQELLALNGRYAGMWEKHCRAERAAEHARDATRKAKKLLCQANISRVDEGSDGYSSMVSSTILPTRLNSPTHGSAKDSSSESSDSGKSDKSDNASISSRESHSGSEGTLREDGCEESRQDEMADDEYSPSDEVDEPLARHQQITEARSQTAQTSISPQTRPSAP
ncbi:heavy metal tolerance protein [Echria macrotheca]|uniref:Heavy metal tolerance protein n=1 Tax=Echria macrotheca TaxID=438768 RepID=A0AAJ0F370_9PEZI|nr:heavy metal tolerance protein [Echria macrotheca]